MVYEAFLETVLSRIRSVLDHQASVSLRKIPKNNGVLLDSLCICPHNHSVAPAIYLNDYFQQYRSGVSIDSIISDILAVYQENSHPDEIRFRSFTSFPEARTHIVYKLVSTASNTDLLNQIPHLPFLDLSIVFYLFFEENGSCYSSIITNRQLDFWNMTPEDLLSLALENSLLLLPPALRSMSEVIREMARIHLGEAYDPDLMGEILSDESTDQPLYVLTNASEFNGAGCLLYPGQLKNFADAAGSDLIVLPSSVHEVLLTPDRGSSHYCSLSTMVSQINEEEVRQEDRLSDHIYLYSRSTGLLSTPWGESSPLPF